MARRQRQPMAVLLPRSSAAAPRHQRASKRAAEPAAAADPLPLGRRPEGRPRLPPSQVLLAVAATPRAARQARALRRSQTPPGAWRPWAAEAG